MVSFLLHWVGYQHHHDDIHWTVQCREFQPQLGVVARTLALALPALFHMMLLIFVLFLFIPYLLCLMFGETTAQLCTFSGKHAPYDSLHGTACNTQSKLLPFMRNFCVEMMYTAAGSSETFFSLLIIGDFMGTRDDLHAQQDAIIFAWTDTVAQVWASEQVSASYCCPHLQQGHKGSAALFKAFNMQSIYLWVLPFFIKACFLGIIIGIIIDTFHG